MGKETREEGGAMAQSIREVMTKDPVTLDVSASVADAARAMRDQDIGDVLITQGDQLYGILTDRDVAVRCVAEGMDPQGTPVKDCCTTDVAMLSPNDSVGDAIKTIREKAIRRLPIVEHEKPVGIVSLGDLALERDRESALADVSAAPPSQ